MLGKIKSLKYVIFYDRVVRIMFWVSTWRRIIKYCQWVYLWAIATSYFTFMSTIQGWKVDFSALKIFGQHHLFYHISLHVLICCFVFVVYLCFSSRDYRTFNRTFHNTLIFQPSALINCSQINSRILLKVLTIIDLIDVPRQ